MNHQSTKPAGNDGGIKEADAPSVCYAIADRESLRAPKIKACSQYGAGVDNIDIEAAPGAHSSYQYPPRFTEATADLIWLSFLPLQGILAIVLSGGNSTVGRRYCLWRRSYGKTPGIIGIRIGQAVARRAIGFGMNIVYCKRKRLLLHITGVQGYIYAAG